MTFQGKEHLTLSSAITTFEGIVFVKGNQSVEASNQTVSKTNHSKNSHRRSTSNKKTAVGLKASLFLLVIIMVFLDI